MAVLSSPISLKAFFCDAWRVDTIKKSSNDKVKIVPLSYKFARHNMQSEAACLTQNDIKYGV